MHSSKTILIICLATIVTFMVALGALVVLNRPELLDRFDPRSRTEASRDHDARTGQTTQSPTSAGGCLVNGRILDPKGMPVSDAYVHALEETVRAGQEPELLKTVQTDAEGRFHLALEEPRDSIRMVVCADDLPRWQKHRLGLTDQDDGTDLGDVKIEVGGTLKVYVRDEEGRSVYGASVQVMDPWEVPDTLRRDLLSAQTEADGVAVVQGTDFGHYQVTVSKEGYSTSVQTMSFDLANPMDGFAMDAVIFHATSYVRGSVKDTAGTPITEGAVLASPMRSDLTEIFRADLTEDGSFKVGPLPKGEYQVNVEATGMTQRTTVLTTADSAPLRLVVDYSGKVTGTISLPPDGSHDSVQLSVSRRSRGGRLIPHQGAHHAQVDPDTLQFMVEGLPEGVYQVRAICSGLAAGRSQEFELAAGEHEADVMVELCSGGSVRGQIVDSRGTGTGHATISVFEGEAAPSAATLPLYTGTTRAQATSEADGSFLLRRLSPGLHMVVVESPGMPTRSYGPLLVQDKVDTSLGQVVLGGGGSISGTRLNSEGEADAGLIRVQASTGSLLLLLMTDENGHYGLRGLPPGSYTLHAVVGPNEANEPPAALPLRSGEQLRHDPRER